MFFALVLMANKMQSVSETTQPTSYTRGQQYNPQDDTHYIEVLRPPRHDHRRLERLMNNPAFQTGSDSSYGARNASPHGEDEGWYSFGNMLSTPHARQTQSGEANRAQPAGTSSYAPQIMRRTPEHDYSEPYNAVGFVRRDGRVHDNAEVYEEYRPYEQVDRFDEDRSEAWTNVSFPRLVKPENGNAKNHRFQK